MIPLVAFPTVVEHYAPHFASVFSDAAFIQFKRYISGLLVAENKTVEGINRLFVLESRHQSSLNRLLTATPFSLPALNQARLALLQTVPGTAASPPASSASTTHYLPITSSTLTTSLTCMTTRSSAMSGRTIWSRYITVMTSRTIRSRLNCGIPPDVPTLEAGLEQAGFALKPSKSVLKQTAPAKWRRYLLGVWRRHQDQPAVAALYANKLQIAQRLIRDSWAQPTVLPLPVTFDSWYTQPAFCHALDQAGVAYVGTLSGDAVVVLKRVRSLWQSSPPG